MCKICRPYRGQGEGVLPHDRRIFLRGLVFYEAMLKLVFGP